MTQVWNLCLIGVQREIFNSYTHIAVGKAHQEQKGCPTQGQLLFVKKYENKIGYQKRLWPCEKPKNESSFSS